MRYTISIRRAGRVEGGEGSGPGSGCPPLAAAHGAFDRLFVLARIAEPGAFRRYCEANARQMELEKPKMSHRTQHIQKKTLTHSRSHRTIIARYHLAVTHAVAEAVRPVVVVVVVIPISSCVRCRRGCTTRTAGGHRAARARTCGGRVDRRAARDGHPWTLKLCRVRDAPVLQRQPVRVVSTPRCVVRRTGERRRQ